MTLFTDLFSQTLANLRANKMRSFLTMFGIVWGVVSILVLSAVGEGFLQGNQKVLRELGKNILIIRNGRTSMQAGGERAGKIVRLTYDDVLALRRESTLIEQISPELTHSVQAKSRFNASAVQISGIWPPYQWMRTIEVDRGRLINEQDCADARRVVVLGFDASKQLFADRDPSGQRVMLDGIPYTVVGRVRKKQQDSNYQGQDDGRLFIPYETARKDFPIALPQYTADHVSVVIAAPYDWVSDMVRQMMERGERGSGSFIGFNARGPVEQEVREILAKRHGFDPRDTEALSFWNTQLEAVLFDRMIAAMDEFFTAVAIVTLLLGGIGVMNIMLVAVKERTQEIGVRKAIGATPRTILLQFMSEGLLLTGVSGIIGFFVGWGLCALANLAPMPERFSGMIITWQVGAFAVLLLMAIGVAAAAYPARKAAALPPIEALRYEA
ncbi:MAG: ABC transporter permease [Acidobacteriota bacterium]